MYGVSVEIRDMNLLSEALDRQRTNATIFTKHGKHDVTQLSRKLKDLRTKKGLTVRELAEKIGKSPGYVSRIEVRGEVPSPELLCTIASVFKVKPESLLALAKEAQLEHAARTIDQRQLSALALHRKETK